MADYAELLALGYDCIRTRHAYYRQLRLLHDHFQCDPRLITEEQLRDYLPHPKINKGDKNQRNFFSVKDLSLDFSLKEQITRSQPPNAKASPSCTIQTPNSG